MNWGPVPLSCYGQNPGHPATLKFFELNFEHLRPGRVKRQIGTMDHQEYFYSEDESDTPRPQESEEELISYDEVKRRTYADVQKAGLKILEKLNGPEPPVSRRMRAAVEKAKDKVLYELCVEDARARLDEGDYEWFNDRPRPIDYTLKGMHEAQIARLKLRATAKNNRGTFITCSPPEMTNEEFIQGLNDFIAYLIAAGASGVFTIEQRGETPDNIHGKHVHILLPDTVIPRQTMLPSAAEAFWGKRTAKPLPMQFNVKFTHTDTDNENTLNYMDPDKQQKNSKMPKLSVDAILRETLRIEALTAFQ